MVRMGYVALAGALLVAILAASGATAQDAHNQAEIACKPKAKAGVCTGTEGDDKIDGSRRSDLIEGLGGNDTITEARGIKYHGRGLLKGPDDRDVVFGGEGNDIISVYDSDNLDMVDCGPGDEDFVFANYREREFARAHGCERVPLVD